MAALIIISPCRFIIYNIHAISPLHPSNTRLIPVKYPLNTRVETECFTMTVVLKSSKKALSHDRAFYIYVVFLTERRRMFFERFLFTAPE